VAAFDECIFELIAQLGTLKERNAAQVQELYAPGAPADLVEGLGVRIGAGANPGIILRGDTSVEFGNPEVGSCSALLWTDDLSLVVDGRITVIGPDVPESVGQSLPLAQVALVAGSGLDHGDHEALQQSAHVSDQVEGYMAKSTSEFVWARVSHEAVAQGIDFAILGRALLYLVKTSVAKVSVAEVVFVTASREDVDAVATLVRQARVIGARIVTENWRERGFDLDCDFDCSSCSDEEICDDIRDVLVATHAKSRSG
jgi:CO dehydrogenase/acetyl-CoA synthase beta subunit